MVARVAGTAGQTAPAAPSACAEGAGLPQAQVARVPSALPAGLPCLAIMEKRPRVGAGPMEVVASSLPARTATDAVGWAPEAHGVRAPVPPVPGTLQTGASAVADPDPARRAEAKGPIGPVSARGPAAPKGGAMEMGRGAALEAGGVIVAYVGRVEGPSQVPVTAVQVPDIEARLAQAAVPEAYADVAPIGAAGTPYPPSQATEAVATGLVVATHGEKATPVHPGQQVGPRGGRRADASGPGPGEEAGVARDGRRHTPSKVLAPSRQVGPIGEGGRRGSPKPALLRGRPAEVGLQVRRIVPAVEEATPQVAPVLQGEAIVTGGEAPAVVVLPAAVPVPVLVVRPEAVRDDPGPLLRAPAAGATVAVAGAPLRGGLRQVGGLAP